MITVTLHLYGLPVIRSKPIASMTEAVIRARRWQETFRRVGTVTMSTETESVEVPAFLTPDVTLPVPGKRLPKGVVA